MRLFHADLLTVVKVQLLSCNVALKYNSFKLWSMKDQMSKLCAITCLKPVLCWLFRGCPVCRVKSDFYLPSASMLDGEEKEQLIISIKQRCRFVLSVIFWNSVMVFNMGGLHADTDAVFCICFCRWVPEKNTAVFLLNPDSAPLKRNVAT